MVVTVRVVLMILSLICFLLGALNVSPPRGNLICAGLFLWCFADLLAPMGH